MSERGVGADPGVLVISLDFELHWGVRDWAGPMSPYRANLLGARAIIPRLLDVFSKYQIAATWATVGFLFAGSRDELEAFSPIRRPLYVREELNPYQEPVGLDEHNDPLHFARSLVTEIAAEPGQEIASHTFSHYLCLEDGQDEAAFRADINAACRIAESRGIRLRSIVFPSNQLNSSYLPVLKEAGFIAYRGNQSGQFHKASRKGEQGLARRAMRAADCYVPLERAHLSCWDELVEPVGLCNVAASRFLRPYSPSIPLVEPLRLQRVVSSLEQAARSKRIFHLWWHPHNFGANSEENLAFLAKVLEAFTVLRDRYGMRSMTMAEVAGRALARAA